MKTLLTIFFFLGFTVGRNTQQEKKSVDMIQDCVVDYMDYMAKKSAKNYLLVLIIDKDSTNLGLSVHHIFNKEIVEAVNPNFVMRYMKKPVLVRARGLNKNFIGLLGLERFKNQEEVLLNLKSMEELIVEGRFQSLYAHIVNGSYRSYSIMYTDEIYNFNEFLDLYDLTIIDSLNKAIIAEDSLKHIKMQKK